MTGFLSKLGLLAAGLGAAGAYFRITSPIFGFYLVLGGGALMALMVLPALGKLFKRKKSRAMGSNRMPKLALLLGLISAGGIGYLAKLATESPLNDLSTDTDAPAKFVHGASLIPGLDGSSLEPSLRVERPYNPEQGLLQNEHFPGLEPLTSAAPPASVYLALEKAAREMPSEWKLVLADPGKLQLEFEVESGIFHFVDDVVIWVRPNQKAGGSRVDIRSRSRNGQSDLGANKKRIDFLKEKLQPLMGGAGGKS